jgi:hypothetical protein
MEHSAERSSHSLVIKVLPEGFTEPGQCTGSTPKSQARGAGKVVLFVQAFSCIMALLLLGVFLSIALRNGASTELRLTALAVSFLSLPFVIGPIWYAAFVISRPVFDFSDPIRLLKTEGVLCISDLLTILRYRLLGTESAIILDHQNESLHFFNCHVAKGFIPKVLRVYSCKTDSLQFHEITYDI